jgi:hypothetical protein
MAHVVRAPVADPQLLQRDFPEAAHVCDRLVFPRLVRLCPLGGGLGAMPPTFCGHANSVRFIRKSTWTGPPTDGVRGAIERCRDNKYQLEDLSEILCAGPEFIVR